MAVALQILRDIFRRRIHRTAPQRILFTGRYHLGDVLMTLPALRLAREHLPDAEMTLVVQERYRHELNLQEISIKTIPEFEGFSFYSEVQAWRVRLRQERYDAIVFHRITRPDFPAIIAAFLENIPHRMGGAEKGLQGFLTDLYCPSARERVVEYHWNLVRTWLQLPPCAPHLRWPQLVDAPSSPSQWDLLIAPFAQHTKEWPPEHWHAFLRALQKRGLSVALSAGPNQADRAAELLKNFPSVVNLSQQSKSLGDLFSHVQAAKCVVAVDTGIRHVAASLGIPCLVLGHGREHHRLFGAYVPTERYLFHPVVCAPCGAEPCPLGHLQCIRGITLEKVLSELAELLPSFPRES